MNDFTASNGVTIRVDMDGDYAFSGSRSTYMVQPGSKNEQALRELFQAEADERLGRWRCPEVPDYLVYPPSSSHKVHVVRESDGETRSYARNSPTFAFPSGEHREWALAARAYFEAHPEPKPWHAAVEGDVWELTFAAGAHAWFVNGDYFQSTKTLTNISKTDADILSARRIYPEAAE